VKNFAVVPALRLGLLVVMPWLNTTVTAPRKLEKFVPVIVGFGGTVPPPLV
jgi:hypothetical protein